MIREGNSRKSTWQLLKEERGRTRARLHRQKKGRSGAEADSRPHEFESAAAADAAYAQRRAAEASESLDWGWGSWVCSRCNQTNTASAWTCRRWHEGAVCGESFDHAASWAWTSEYAPARPAAHGATRTTKTRRLVEEALRADDGWLCGVCHVSNVLQRAKCYHCSRPRELVDDTFDPATRSSGAAAGDATRPADALGRRKARKRGSGSSKYDPRWSEQNHPYAHLPADIPTVGVVAAGVLLSGWKLTVVLLNQAERMVVTTSYVVTDFLVEVGEQLTHVTEFSALCLKGLVFILIIRLAWNLTPKAALAATGYNPEGNVRDRDAREDEMDWLGDAELVYKVQSYFKAVKLEARLIVTAPAEGAAVGMRTYEVGSYRVVTSSKLSRCTCSCPAWVSTGDACKHIAAAYREHRSGATGSAAVEPGRSRNRSRRPRQVPLPAETEPAAPSEAPVAERRWAPGEGPSQSPTVGRRLPILETAGDPLPGRRVSFREQPMERWTALRTKVLHLTQRTEDEPAGPARAAAASGSSGREAEGDLSRRIDALTEAARALEIRPGGGPAQAAPPPPEGQQNSNARMLYGARAVQETAIALMTAAPEGSTVVLLAFTFDREDVAEVLIATKSRGVTVRVIADRRQTLTGAVEQRRVLQLLAAKGVHTRVLSGFPLTPEYLAAGRNALGGLKGILHTKMMCIAYPDQHVEVLSGSANWTTSSRGNHELNTLVTFPRGDAQGDELTAWCDGLWANAEELTTAAQSAAYRSKSAGRGDF